MRKTKCRGWTICQTGEVLRVVISQETIQKEKKNLDEPGRLQCLGLAEGKVRA